MNPLPLTRRQKVALATLADMGTQQAVADAMGVSYETAREHIHHACKRLGVHTAVQAVAVFVRHETLAGTQHSRATRPCVSDDQASAALS